MEDLNNAIDTNNPQIGQIVSNLSTLTQIDPQLIEDYEPDAKLEITTLEKASYDCGDLYIGSVQDSSSLGTDVEVEDVVIQSESIPKNDSKEDAERNIAEVKTISSFEIQQDHVENLLSLSKPDLKTTTSERIEEVVKVDEQKEVKGDEEKEFVSANQKPYSEDIKNIDADLNPTELLVKGSDEVQMEKLIDNAVSLVSSQELVQMDDCTLDEAKQVEHIHREIINEQNKFDRLNPSESGDSSEKVSNEPESSITSFKISEENRPQDTNQPVETDADLNLPSIVSTQQDELPTEVCAKEEFSPAIDADLEEPKLKYPVKDIESHNESPVEKGSKEEMVQVDKSVSGESEKEVISEEEIGKRQKTESKRRKEEKHLQSNSTSSNDTENAREINHSISTEPATGEADLDVSKDDESLAKVAEPSGRPVRAVRSRASQKLPQPAQSPKPETTPDQKRGLKRPRIQLSRQPQSQLSIDQKPIQKQQLKLKQQQQQLSQSDNDLSPEPARKVATKGASRSRFTIATSAPRQLDRNSLSEEDSSGKKMYRCGDCNYSTERLNNIVYHKKNTCEDFKQRYNAQVEEYKKVLQSPKGSKKRFSR